MHKENWKQCKHAVFRDVNLTTQLSIKTTLQKVDQHIGSKWQFHDAKHHNGNQLQNLVGMFDCTVLYNWIWRSDTKTLNDNERK